MQTGLAVQCQDRDGETHAAATTIAQCGHQKHDGAIIATTRSRLIVMEPDGRYRVLAHGLQSNGTIAARTANLIVCDMFGHRVVELDPANGRVPGVMLDRINGRLIVPPAREREMLDAFHNTFVPEAVKHEGYIRVKMLKRRSVVQGTAPAAHNYRFELEFESEELRQKWIASAGHQRVWPLVERTMTTQKDYPVVLYDEV